LLKNKIIIMAIYAISRKKGGENDFGPSRMWREMAEWEATPGLRKASPN
jgi:hypothetical protein